MKAGQLDRLVRIERATETVDAYGAPALDWVPIGMARAQVLSTSTEEFIREAGASGDTVVVFRTRFLAGVTVSDRLVHAGVSHDVKAVREIGRRDGLELRTIARGAA